MLTPGTLLQNRYRIAQQIGGGGMGTVYLAEDTRLPGRRCAVKEMSPAQVSPQDHNWAISAFKQEAQMLAYLRHPGLTTVTDFFPEGGNWYLVMDYVQGETLEDRLQRAPGHCLPLQEALNIARQLCSVLEYLHRQNPPVVFRDLKPGNVMITPRSEIKLIDFGIARFFKPGRARDTVSLGTTGYAAPEQYGGQGQTDPRSDIYGFGVLLHQMVTGYDPTQAPLNLPPIRSLKAGVPATVEAAIEQAIQTSPDLRFQSVGELSQALFAPAPPVVLTGQGSGAPPRPSPRLLGGAGLALIGLVAVVVTAVAVNANKPTPTSAPAVLAPTATLAQPKAPTIAPFPNPTDTPRATALPAKPAGAPTATAIIMLTKTPMTQPLDTLVPTTASSINPSDTPIPTRTPIPPPTVAPTAACPAVTGPFASLWSSTKDKLGCATGGAQSIWMAAETFQRGQMFWRQDNKQIYALFNGNGWSRHNDTWQDGDPESSCTGGSPLTPVRGFGKVWCSVPAVRNGLGGATTGEQGYNGTVQDFQHGVIIRTDAGQNYVLYSGNGWEIR